MPCNPTNFALLLCALGTNRHFMGRMLLAMQLMLCVSHPASILSLGYYLLALGLVPKAVLARRHSTSMRRG